MPATLTGPEIARKKKALLTYLRGGHPLKQALKLCQLTERTVGQWCSTDKTFSEQLRESVGLGPET